MGASRPVARLVATILLGMLALVWPTNPALAQTFSSGADVVYVRKDCTGLSNCATDIATVENWLWTVRSPAPSASSRVLVDIGPGDFGSFSCPGPTNSVPHGYVTLRGAGQDQTRLVRADTSTLAGAIDVDSCEQLVVESLTVRGAVLGVEWVGSGSRIVALGDYENYAFYARCAEEWFYGGEVRATSNESPSTVNAQLAVYVVDDGDFRAFGTAIRSDVGTATAATFSNNVVGVAVTGPSFGVKGGTFHMHGGIISIDASASTSDVNVVGLSAEADAVLAHTPGTAFALKRGGNGTATRLSGPATVVMSPFLWQTGTTPPSIASIDGADVFVETDCGSDGACDAGGTETHTMVYNSALCTGGSPWFDTTTGRCRNDTNDPVAALQAAAQTLQTAVQSLDQRVTALENP